MLHFYCYNYYYRFKGEYLNGKKNGKGKEYNNQGTLIFEGEYLNGKKWNGIEYDEFGKIISEIKNGKGTFRKYECGKLIYEEEYLDGKLTREAKEYTYLNGGLIYEGEVLNQKRNGKGKEYNSINGSLKFEGEYLLGERHGKGKEYKNGKLRFEGEYINGKRNGKGKEYNDKGELIFEGEYLNGYKWDGKLYGIDKSVYEELKDGKGIIKEYKLNELTFEGELFNDQRNGKGKEYLGGRIIYEGEYLNGKRYNGKGYDPNNNIIYE